VSRELLFHSQRHTTSHAQNIYVLDAQVQELKAERDALRKEVSTMQADAAKREKKLKMELERVRQQLEEATQRNAELVRELKFSEEARIAQARPCVVYTGVCVYPCTYVLLYVSTPTGCSALYNLYAQDIQGIGRLNKCMGKYRHASRKVQ
jgi:hypothetical protein